MDPPKVSIMVLNYNGLKWLPTCLASVLATEYPNFDVYLVDNGSTDGSVDYVKKGFSSVKVIQHSANLGFAEGYSRAIKRVEADYVLLLNNDVQVLNPRWVKALVDIADKDPRIAGVACKMVSMEDHSQLDSVGGMGIPFWRGFVDIGHEERDHGQYDHKGFEPFSFCGGAALVRCELFENIGGFDSRFFLYLEDVDLSWRFRLLGYRIAFAAEARVAHYSSGSSETQVITPWKLYCCHKNLLASILKNCGPSLKWALRSYIIFSFMEVAGFLILQPKKAVAIAGAILWNMVNLRNTYARRLTTQKTRLTKEGEVLSVMYPKLGRYQPAEHLVLRRLLNILFEHSQLPVLKRFIEETSG